ncbi:MAG: N-acetyltransferase [Gemmatimonadetes bacterium]|nr:N-acetyltransferase [Gemmatimonadota bacterium]
MTSNHVAEQQADESRFIIRSGNRTAQLKYNRIGSQIILEHTDVPKELQGQGLAGALAHAALEYARANGLSVIPTCPFVIQYLSSHPEYQSLVKNARFVTESDAE